MLHAELARAGLASLDALIDGDLAGTELAQRAAQHRRLRALTFANGSRWRAGMRGTITGGFVTGIELVANDAEDIVRLRERLACEPIRSLQIDSTKLPPRLFATLPLGSITRFVDGFATFDRAPILAAMPKLETLSLREQSAAQLARLPPMPALRRLAISITSNAALDALATWAPNIQSLAIFDDRPAFDLARILDGRFPDLRELVVRGLTDDTLIATPPRVQLRVLNDFEADLGPRGLELLCGEPLEEIVLGLANGDAIGAILACAPNLTTLDIADGVDDDATAARIAGARQRLRTLRLENAELDARAIQKILAAHDLTALAIHNASTMVAGRVAHEPRTRSLRRLSISGPRLMLQAISNLAHAPHLENLHRLEIDHAKLDDDAMVHVTRFTNLVALSATNGAFRIAPAFLAMPALVELSMSLLGSSPAVEAAQLHFGAIGGVARSHDLIVLFDGPLDDATLDRALRTQFVVERDPRGRLCVRLGRDRVFLAIGRPKHDGVAVLASRVAPIERRVAIAALPAYVELDVRDFPEDRTAQIELARAIASLCDGVVWDEYEDAIL